MIFATGYFILAIYWSRLVISTSYEDHDLQRLNMNKNEIIPVDIENVNDMENPNNTNESNGLNSEKIIRTNFDDRGPTTNRGNGNLRKNTRIPIQMPSYLSNEPSKSPRNKIDRPKVRKPVANDDHITTYFSQEVTFNVTSNDFDHDGNLEIATLTPITYPQFGHIVVYLNGSFRYIPQHGSKRSTDSFRYMICNTAKLCDYANVFIALNEWKCTGELCSSDPSSLRLQFTNLNHHLTQDNSVDHQIEDGYPSRVIVRSGNSSKLYFDQLLNPNDIFEVNDEETLPLDLSIQILNQNSSVVYENFIITVSCTGDSMYVGKEFGALTVVGFHNPSQGSVRGCEVGSCESIRCMYQPSEIYFMIIDNSCENSANNQGTNFSCFIENNALTFPLSVKISSFDQNVEFFNDVIRREEDIIRIDNRQSSIDRLLVEIFDVRQRTILQIFSFQSSCTLPLTIGETFGSLKLVEFTNDIQGTVVCTSSKSNFNRSMPSSIPSKAPIISPIGFQNKTMEDLTEIPSHFPSSVKTVYSISPSVGSAQENTGPFFPTPSISPSTIPSDNPTVFPNVGSNYTSLNSSQVINETSPFNSSYPLQEKMPSHTPTMLPSKLTTESSEPSQGRIDILPVQPSALLSQKPTHVQTKFPSPIMLPINSPGNFSAEPTAGTFKGFPVQLSKRPTISFSPNPSAHLPLPYNNDTSSDISDSSNISWIAPSQTPSTRPSNTSVLASDEKPHSIIDYNNHSSHFQHTSECVRSRCIDIPSMMKFQFLGGNCSSSRNNQTKNDSICLIDNHISYPAAIQINSIDLKREYFRGLVKEVGDLFEVTIEDLFPAEINVQIRDESFTRINQMFTFRTSCCAKRLYLGDIFMSIRLVQFQNDAQGVVSCGIKEINE